MVQKTSLWFEMLGLDKQFGKWVDGLVKKHY